MDRTDLPLCVDLDGTFIRSDLLIESALALDRDRRPLMIFAMFAWLLRGKAHLKKKSHDVSCWTRPPYPTTNHSSRGS